MDLWCLLWVLLYDIFLVVSGMPNPENIDVDGGKNNDIFDINHALGLHLFEGDIELGGRDISALVGSNKWPQTIPVVLADNLELNAKGIILRAFERFHLKTCIKFKQWKGEDNYIFIYRGEGCFSTVGNAHFGRQEISIGYLCDKIGLVQHELFHTLGFVHEQSRSDRNDYVTIREDNILPVEAFLHILCDVAVTGVLNTMMSSYKDLKAESKINLKNLTSYYNLRLTKHFLELLNDSSPDMGKESNFKYFSDKLLEYLNVPYDYMSLLHFPQHAFQKGSEPTIVTRNPDFMDMIGQRIDFSDCDVEKLNRRYNCSSSKTFMDSCDFELENICGMIQNSEDNGDWQRVSQVSGGPDSDHSYLGKCKGSCFFMYFSRNSVKEGGKAILESRLFYPKRKFQCLQFYYYNSGNKDDKLKIYVREYFTAHSNMSLTLVDELKDAPLGSWQLHYVSLAVTKKFRIVFEGTRGTGTSAGGLSIDDINLSETKCPHHIWRINNFTQILSSREVIYSPPFYSHSGYAFQVQLDVRNQTNVGIYFFLISGANDEELEWPCPWHQATMTLLDQNPDIRRSMSNERSITTDPLKTIDSNIENFFWDKPSKVGVTTTFPNGTSYSRSLAFGTSTYITHKWLQRRDFIKGDTVYILLTVEDISSLFFTEPLPGEFPVPISKPNISVCAKFVCENDGICVIRNNKTECRCQSGKDWWYRGEKCETMGSTKNTIFITVLFATGIFISMLIVALLSVRHVKKKYRKRSKANTLQNEFRYNDEDTVEE